MGFNYRTKNFPAKAAPERCLALPGFVIVVGPQGFCFILQANYFRAALVFYSAIIYYPDFCFCFWQPGWFKYRWITAAIILYDGCGGLELFF